jgi:hypothetical protein
MTLCIQRWWRHCQKFSALRILFMSTTWHRRRNQETCKQSGCCVTVLRAQSNQNNKSVLNAEPRIHPLCCNRHVKIQ